MNNLLTIRNSEPQLIELGNGLKAYMGVPLKQEIRSGMVEVQAPKIPHIFQASKFQFNRTVPIFENVNILIAHAGLKLENGRYTWCFQDHQIVGDIVDNFNSQSDTSIDFVIGCSGSYADLNTSLELFPLSELPDSNIVDGLPGCSYIFGEDIGLQSFLIPDSYTVYLSVNCDLSKLQRPEFLQRKKSKLEYKEF